ncbi:MAG TPA: hypothetical protein VJY62_05115, partial [Bacteroidia bacterium]|nr:hypothetical protein [Bacteroidia bacterium]
KEPTYSYGGVAKVFTSVLKEILIAKGKKNADEIKIVIEKYLTQEYAQSIFKRLIFFLIYNFWDDLHSYFWKLLKDTSAVNYLLEFSYANETYPILKKYGQKFTLDEKQNIEKIVEHGINVKYNEPKDQEYYRYRIYSSFAGDSYFDSKINELKDKLNYTDLKESREETSGVLTSDTRSFMALELFQKSNKEIIDFLKAYKPVKFEDIPIYTYADQLQNSIAENPNKFISSLLEFNILQLTYISRIILGFKDAWNRNNLFDWEILLNFINEFISTKKFAENAFIIEEQFPKVTREWVIASIGELIQVGTQDDIKAFDVRLIPKAMSILDNLSQYIQKEESLPDGRYVDHPLNSPFGRLITAIIYTALRKARVEYKDKDVQKIKWDEKTKSIYQNILNKPNIDGFILFGFYLNQFHFLDYYWTNSEIDQIHKMENDLWTGFMSAYTFRSNFNQDLYLKMRPNYEKAIKKNFNSVSEHIGVAIIWEIEKYEKGSLLEYFLRNCTPAAISELIHFFSKNEEYIKGMKKNEIILNLWETIFTSLKIKSGDQLNSTIAGLARLMSFTDEINEKIKLLLEESIKFMKEGFLSSELIEELVRIIKTKLNKQTAKDIGELYLKLLDISTPTHKQDHIIELINTLYSFDDRELDLISNEIANIYGTRGLYFLKDLYFEHN